MFPVTRHTRVVLGATLMTRDCALCMGRSVSADAIDPPFERALCVWCVHAMHRQGRALLVRKPSRGTSIENPLVWSWPSGVCNPGFQFQHLVVMCTVNPRGCGGLEGPHPQILTRRSCTPTIAEREGKDRETREQVRHTCRHEKEVWLAYDNIAAQRSVFINCERARVVFFVKPSQLCGHRFNAALDWMRCMDPPRNTIVWQRISTL